MWSSITDTFIPKSFEEAIDLKKNKNCVFFGGGTYLVSEKDKNIHRIIDINNLTDNSIEIKDDKIIIGAGVTIQEIVDGDKELQKLSTIAKQSHFSKNIRNQRTNGGEIAHRNILSDLFTYLVALNPQLEIMNHKSQPVKMRDWNGEGIINKIMVNKIDILSSGFERFSVIPSAPAFLMVAVVRRALELDFVISGRSKKIFGHTMPLVEFSKSTLKGIINDSVKYFEDDQHGSIVYKKSLIATGIQRAVEQI